MKMLKWLPTIILCVGLTLLAISGAWTIHNLMFIRRAVSASGTIIENVARTTEEEDSDHNKHFETYYYPKVRFQTRDGQTVTFLSTTGVNPPHPIGESLPVLYDPADPAGALVDNATEWIFPAVFFVVGAIFTPWPIIFFRQQRRRNREKVWLQSHGQRIQSDFTRVEINPDIKINDASPYRVVSQFLDPKTNRIFLFKSDDIWFDPHKYAEGKPIDVIVDPNDLSRYFMETTFLPQIAETPRPKGFKARVAGWWKRRIQWLRDRWKKLTDPSLDRRLYLFYTLCMWGLLWLNGALSIRLQLLFAGVLVVGLVQFAAWYRLSSGWRWLDSRPGGKKLTPRVAAKKIMTWAAEHIDTSWEVQAPGELKSGSSSRVLFWFPMGAVALLLVVAMILMPISQPAFFGWYLWGLGSAAYVILRALGLAAGTRTEFRKACPAASAARGEARWKRKSRTAYEIVFLFVWLLCLVLFYLSGILGMRSDSSIPTFLRSRMILDHAPWVSSIFLHTGLITLLRNSFLVTWALAVALMFVLHYGLKVRLLPKSATHQ